MHFLPSNQRTEKRSSANKINNNHGIVICLKIEVFQDFQLDVRKITFQVDFHFRKFQTNHHTTKKFVTVHTPPKKGTLCSSGWILECFYAFKVICLPKFIETISPAFFTIFNQVLLIHFYPVPQFSFFTILCLQISLGRLTFNGIFLLFFSITWTSQNFKHFTSHFEILFLVFVFPISGNILFLGIKTTFLMMLGKIWIRPNIYVSVFFFSSQQRLSNKLIKHSIFTRPDVARKLLKILPKSMQIFRIALHNSGGQHCREF